MSALPSPGGGLRQKLAARKMGSGRNMGGGALSPTNLPPESQFAMKTLNVTVDAGDGNELPASLTRADIGVQVLVSLENSGHNEKRDEKAAQVAETIQQEAQELLTKEFCSEKAVDECPYLLKVYVVLAIGTKPLAQTHAGTGGGAPAGVPRVVFAVAIPG